MRTEIMAPAGSYESLQAALKAGADSVYFGIEQLNMRARAAKTFTIEDLKKIVDICKEKDVRTYLAVNTILYDHDISVMKNIIDEAHKAGVTAIIASDISAIQYTHSIGMEVHISTQCNISNVEAVKFFAPFADVMVLARELTLQQIKHICDSIIEENIRGPSGELVQIEVFVHGALCVAVSGKCYMSLGTYNASANRGACLQNCRRSYRVIDEETGDELRLENKHVMSPKDLCCIKFLDKLADAGVVVFKIEGRGRAPDYVYKVVKAYKEAVLSIEEGTYTTEKIDAWVKELETVFNRGFWHGGYYLGKQLGEWSGEYGSTATEEKVFVGVVKNYFQKIGIAEVHLEAAVINKGDKILFTGPTTGVVQAVAEVLRVDDAEVDTAPKGSLVTFIVPEKVRLSDKCYVIKDA